MINRKTAQHFICVKDKKKSNNRYVTVIGHLPFYQSTGHNSHERDTWLPFMGLQEFDKKEWRLPKGLFLKPTTNTNETHFPKTLCDYFRRNDSITEELINRLGNFETMCFSMLIGGGFWDKEAGKELKEFIVKHYNTEVNALANHWQQEIKEIKELNKQNKIEVFDNNEPKKINTWSQENGSIGKKDEHGLTTIHFNYPDFRNQKVDIKHSNNNNLNQLIEAIRKAKHAIGNSFQFYRAEAKQQKIIVLTAAEDYLNGKIDENELKKCIRNNPKYADSFFKSETKSLIDKALETTPETITPLPQSKKPANQ